MFLILIYCLCVTCFYNQLYNVYFSWLSWQEACIVWELYNSLYANRPEAWAQKNKPGPFISRVSCVNAFQSAYLSKICGESICFNVHLEKFNYRSVKNKVWCHVCITEISVFQSFLTASSSWELLCALWYIFLFVPQTECEDISSNFLCAPTISLISDLLILTWRVLEAS